MQIKWWYLPVEQRNLYNFSSYNNLANFTVCVCVFNTKIFKMFQWILMIWCSWFSIKNSIVYRMLGIISWDLTHGWSVIKIFVRSLFISFSLIIRSHVAPITSIPSTKMTINHSSNKWEKKRRHIFPKLVSSSPQGLIHGSSNVFVSNLFVYILFYFFCLNIYWILFCIDKSYSINIKLNLLVSNNVAPRKSIRMSQ